MTYYELRDNQCCAYPCPIPEADESVDLVVVGMGSAGAFCALSAAQEGLSVLGLERGSCCGGMSVQGAVNGYYNGYPGGAFEEIDASVQEVLGTVYRPFLNHPDAKKLRMEQKLLSAGVKIEYHTVVLGIYADGQRVMGVRALCNGSKREIRCQFLSDSTSDGHLLRILGIRGWFGRTTDGTAQPFSSVRVYRRTDGKLGRTNDDSGYINPYEDAEFSSRVLKANAKHTEDAVGSEERLLYLAPQIGMREGMRFEGEETVTLQDVLEEKLYPHTLCCAYSDIDRHGQDRAFDGRVYQDWYVLSNLSTVTMKIRLPLEILIPKGWKRLVSVSRCLALDEYVSAAVRMNRDMYRLGESAGVAIAMAVQGGVESVQQIDIEELHRKLKSRGCFDPRPEQLRGFVDPKADPPYQPVEWLEDWEAICRELATDCPGVGIWSCRRLGAAKVGDDLARLIQETEDTELRYNAAIALGVLGDRRSLPVLRELVKGRKAYFYEDCRRSNQLRSVIAICLCGRFGDPEIVPELTAILSPEEYERPMYHQYLAPDYKYSITDHLNMVYYQHFSFALAALAQIADQNPDLRGPLSETVKSALADGRYRRRMTADPPDSSYDLIVRALGEFADKAF
ncbi:FAD-dependent oxidoreductase [Bianquea renquensis]|uniref:FAD-dependent oxidoreductase n=1 Tax=Bianquea renquensis TaxID=2763661 RepID=A0A926DR30_9FIRM|nr:FAD-dependent oxidoreductase [Bianquea renquensis]MBC8542247.1 FAD-dependent oxidoreductase [Bianquea renquensis]